MRTVGRKSGLPREIPLNYAPTTRGVALLAGFGRGTGWVYDLRSRPGTEVLVGERVHRATAVEISDPLRARLATRAVLRNDGAAGFFYGWDPRRASDARIDAVVEQTSCFQLVFYEPPPWQPTQHDTVTGR